MSDNLLIFIPTHPQYIPSEQAQQEARVLLESCMPHADEVTVCETPEVEFVATGGNLEDIFCPSCGTHLSMSWWMEAMNKAFLETRFNDLTVSSPCCNRAISLNNLRYELPTGFARFRLVVRNPGTDVDDEVILALEALLQCKLKKIWAHF